MHCDGVEEMPIDNFVADPGKTLGQNAGEPMDAVGNGLQPFGSVIHRIQR